MSFRRMVQAVTFTAISLMAARVTIDSDTFWHLAAGRWMVEHGQLLRADPFSITRGGQPWVYPGWLAQLLLYSIQQAWGYVGLNTFTMAVVVLVFLVVWQTLRGPALLRAFVVALAAAASGIFWSARPQMLTLLLTAVFLWVLSGQRQRKSWTLWLLPVLMALWANLHGGFAVGFLLIGAFLAAEAVEILLAWLLQPARRTETWRAHRTMVGRLALSLGLSVLAVGVNPFGLQMLAYPFKTVGIETLRLHIQEWQSPDFHTTTTWPFLAMLLLEAVALALSNERRGPIELILYLGFAALSLSAARNIALFAIVAAPALARHGGSAIQPVVEAIGAGRQLPGRLARWLNAALVVLMLIAGLLWAIPRINGKATAQALSEDFPVGAIDVLLERNPPGPLFNSYNWGGYIMWRAFPEYRTFVDGRTDLFNDEILTQYLQVYTASEDWQEILDRYSVKLILVEPQSPLALAAKGQGWHRLLVGDHSVLLMAGR